MKTKRIYYIILLFCINICTAFAQGEGTLSLMNSLPQVVNNNPAFVPMYNTSISLPGTSAMAFYSNNGFSYNDIIKHEKDSVKADLTKLYGKLKPKNYITQALQVDLFRIGVRINSKLYMTLSSTAKAYSRVLLPKDLMGVFTNGNAPFIGKTVSLSPSAESLTYIETALGGAYKVNDKLTFGVHAKYLKGITNVNTQSATLNLTTNQDTYALTANGAMNVRTSGIYNFTQSDFDFGKNYNKYLTNSGAAFDLGVTYRLLNKLTLGLSLLDIGSIHWKNNTYSYTLDPNQANYTFSGVDLSKVINGNSSYLSSLGDTLQNRFKVKETAIGSYSTAIPSKMYLSAVYDVKKNFSAGAVFFTQSFRGHTTAGLTLGVNKHFGKIVSAAGSYTIASNSFNNLGAGMSLNLSPIQIYIVGDNLLNIPFHGSDLSAFTNSTKYINLRLGFNLVFGWNKTDEKPSRKIYRTIKRKNS